MRAFGVIVLLPTVAISIVSFAGNTSGEEGQHSHGGVKEDHSWFSPQGSYGYFDDVLDSACPDFDKNSVSADEAGNLIEVQVLPLNAKEILAEDSINQLDSIVTKYDLVSISVNDVKDSISKLDVSKWFGMNIDVCSKHYWSLQLEVNNIRRSDCKIQATRDNGEIASITPNGNHYRGINTNFPGSIVRLSIYDEVIMGTIQDNGETYFLQPVRYIIENEKENLFIIYSEKDVVPYLDEDAVSEEKPKSMAIASASVKREYQNIKDKKEKMLTSSQKILEIATEADWELYQILGSSTSEWIAYILNSVEGIYQEYLDIDIDITYQHVWETQSDPYASTFHEDVYEELREVWNYNDLGNYASVQRDIVHLWTGKNLDGYVVGYARIGSVCSERDHSYSLSMYSTILSYAVARAAHEMGHNLDGHHEDGENCDTNYRTIMCMDYPKQLEFSSAEITRITNYYSDNSSCLYNDNCQAGFIMTGAIEYPDTWRAGDYIETSTTISEDPCGVLGTEVYLKARNSITLKTGFHVTKDTPFIAWLSTYCPE